MRRNIGYIAAILVLIGSSLASMGAVPSQGGVPPQPFLSDYFSGRVFLQGEPAPAGSALVACLDDCDTVFQSQPVLLSPGGEYRLLEINPAERRLRGRDVRFYLVNEHGRIQAQQVSVFDGAYNITNLTLTFVDPLPAAPPVPELPAVGDPLVPQLPKMALGLGALTTAAGLVWLLAQRRRQSFS